MRTFPCLIPFLTAFLTAMWALAPWAAPGVPPATSIAGVKWQDDDRDGVRDPNEHGLEEWTVYLDLDRDGRRDDNEPAVKTDGDGAWELSGAPCALVVVREQLKPGWRQTFPVRGYHVVDMTQGGSVGGIDFGNFWNVDYGDAPYAPGDLGYPTLAANNGAGHYIAGPWLGWEEDDPDADADGQPDATAMGDDLGGWDDENGVVFDRPLYVGRQARVGFLVNVGGIVRGWVDFNANLQWEHPAEMIVDGYYGPGWHVVEFMVPRDAALTTTFARFRISSRRDLEPTDSEGPAPDGEVEDYVVGLAPPPTVFGLEFSVDIGSDRELSDPHADGDESLDPGDVYWWRYDPGQTAPPGGFDGFKDDETIFGKDPFPSPPDLAIPPATAVPVGEGSPDDYAKYFDIDGHDQLDFNLADILPPILDFPIPQYACNSIFPARYLVFSYDDDGPPPWPQNDVPVTVPSVAGNIRGRTGQDDELLAATLTPTAPDRARLAAPPAPLADEVTVSGILAPNPDDGDPSDDDVDSLDIVASPRSAPFWYFTADHEATRGLDPGVIYLATAAGTPVAVVLPDSHLGLYDDLKTQDIEKADVGAFEFAWLPYGEHNDRVLALLFAVHPDDPLTQGVDESGGRDPRMIYASYLTGHSFPYLEEPLAEPIDALALWGAPLTEEKRYDYGDAMDAADAPRYPTLAANNGARHVILRGFCLGAVNDADFDGQPHALALGDDLAVTDDEDGILFTSLPGPGYLGELEAMVTLPADMATAKLDAWVDFNDDGDWDDTGEQVFLSVTVYPGVNALSFRIPKDVVPWRYLASRFRLSRAGGLTPRGEARDGEVEDYVVHVRQGPSETDCGDAPDRPYPTWRNSNGPVHTITPSLRLGQLIDAEADGQPSAAATGDDSVYLDDGDGVTLPDPLLPGTSQTITVEVFSALAGPVDNPPHLDGWIDFNGDGDWDEANEHVIHAVNPPTGSHDYAVNTPIGATPGILTYARFRISSDHLGVTGPASNGEVEDYAVRISIGEGVDFGDAPDGAAAPGYPTLTANNGAQHAIQAGLLLGKRIDHEPDGQPDAAAGGDDLASIDDEDGVIFVQPLSPGAYSAFQVTVATPPGLSAFLDAWVDFNADRDWDDAGEHVVVSATVSSGTFPFGFAVPAGAALGPTYVRFRLSQLQGLGPAGPGGPGEVEDYRVEIGEPHGYKWQQPPVVTSPDDLFYGWDEAMVGWDGDPGVETIVIPADDFVCERADPIRDISLWVSFKDWEGGNDAEPDPPIPPIRLAIWSDVQAGVDAPWSHPGERLWSARTDVGAESLTWTRVGMDYDPRTRTYEIVYRLDIELTHAAAFTQPRPGDVYWLSALGLYTPPDYPPYAIGWATRPRDPASPAPDVAVRMLAGSSDPRAYTLGEPIVDLDTQWDLCFTVGTVEENEKWVSLPNLQGGVDVRCGPRDGRPPTEVLLADDFLCQKSGPITEITFWGAYLGDRQLPGEHMAFNLAIYSNVPAGPDSYSRPGELLWWAYAEPASSVFYAAAEEMFFDPPAQSAIGSSYQIMRYTFQFPRDQAFTQTADTVYWLAIHRSFDVNGDGKVDDTDNAAIQEYDWGFGWKSTPEPYEDVAVWCPVSTYDGPPQLEFPKDVEWLRVIDPTGGAIHLSFSLKTASDPTVCFVQLPQPYLNPPDTYTGWDQLSVDGAQPYAADDWVCSDNRPITDVHWWGSFIGWRHAEPPGEMPVAFRLAVWTDIPAQPGTPESFSHPGTVVWENYCESFTWQFAGWEFDPRHPGALPEAVFYFEQELPREEWFWQDPLDNDVYWLSITAVYASGVQIEHPWGWLTRPRDPQSLAPDDAVAIYVPPSPALYIQYEQGEPLWFPTPAESWDLAFDLTTALGGDIGGVKWYDANGNGQRDNDDYGMEGWGIFLDLNMDGAHSPGDPLTYTDGTGGYRFTGLPPGQYLVMELGQAHWKQTFPTSPPYHVVTIEAGNSFTDADFGNTPYALDWGDLPEDFYETLAASNGPCHRLQTPFLPAFGNVVGDATPDGIPTPGANGDDSDPAGDDEDGVVSKTDFWPGSPTAKVTLAVNTAVGAPAFLNVWIDFELNGFEPDDQVAAGVPVSGPTVIIPTPVPGNLKAGAQVYARFRISTVQQLSWTGPAPDGEVEDRMFTLEEPPLSSIRGVKWHDRNGDGQDDANEPPLPGWPIYLKEVNGQYEAETTTDDNGEYQFGNLPAGTYLVSEAQLPSWEQTFPATPEYNVTLLPGHIAGSLDFGNRQLLDWGDAPDAPAAPLYPTFAANNGARHVIVPGLFLGGLIDPELDGMPGPGANGDDLSDGDDEDGVVFLTPLAAGATATVQVAASQPGYLNAWVDFNADNSWGQAGDQIFSTLPLNVGVNTLSFPVPVGASPGATTFARFRFSTLRYLASDGWAPDGEVEDHVVKIVNTPAATYKWLQPPLRSPQHVPFAEHFWGWTELSTYNGGVKVADDWLCETDQPVTDIHWWGSYLWWDGVEPPQEGAPLGFHIGIWTDTPAETDKPWSHPREMIWETIVPRSALGEHPVGWANHEDHIQYDDTVFQYDYELPTALWFHQAPGANVYWISIAAVYPGNPCFPDMDCDGVIDDNDLPAFDLAMSDPDEYRTQYPGCDPMNGDANGDGVLDFVDRDILECIVARGDPGICCPATLGRNAWGWLTRPHCFNDDAVRIFDPLRPLPGCSFWDGEPITDLAGNSWDLAFALTTRDFGAIQGYKWADLNGNHKWDADEPPIPDWMVFLDTDQDGECDEDEPQTHTNENGSYVFRNLLPGVYDVTEEPHTCWQQSYPTQHASYRVDIVGGELFEGLNFGNRPVCDWGDLPERLYPTLADHNGPLHIVTPGLLLGREIDSEPDGQPIPPARGDDNNGLEDEDGVGNWQGLWARNPDATVDVTVVGTGYLQAWVDFDRNGFQASDQILTNTVLGTGTHTLPFAVPPRALPQTTVAARFRFSSQPSLSWAGPAPDGEVEDYAVHLGASPAVETDHFSGVRFDINLTTPTGGTVPLTLIGPMTTRVFFEGAYDGAADDDDGDGREEVTVEVVDLNLSGAGGGLGLVRLRTRGDVPSTGEYEEDANLTPAVLDLPPFTPTGTADSFFDIFLEIEVGGATFHNAEPLRPHGRIHHKPPAPTDVFGECEPVTLLDESGQPSGYTLACTELQPNPPVETDTFEVTLGDMELRFPGGGTETIAVEGPTVVHVYFEGETEGSADDDDGDGRDDVASRMVQLDLQGTSSLGPVKVRLNPALPSDGQIEEQANNTPGVLDLPPFTPVGTADSFFDIFFEIEVGGQAYHTATPKHMAAILAHKPPATVDLYGNCDEVELLDTNGQPTGIYLVCAHHQPTTPIEIDVFPFSLGKLEILFPDTTTHTVNVSGPTTVHVHFADIEGHASDSDGDGRDDVVTEMVEMNLTGFTPTLGPVAVHLNTARPTLGEIEEQVNNTPGVLDVPPFAATGTADSFFDIFFEIEVGGNVYHNETAKRMTAVIDHKPPRAVTWYSNCDAIELYDAAGAPTGIKILCARHQPNPVVERDLFDLALGAVSLRLPTGDTVAVDLHGKAEQVVIFEGTEEGDASDDNGDGLEEVLAELVSLDLHGVAGPLGPVAVRLDPLRTSHGEINELVNATPGVLDVPPFTATGTADSFFDVFLEIEIAGVKLTTDHPMRIHGRLSHKPAAPGEGFTCLGPQVPLDLLDDSGQSTGFALLCTDLTPIPEGDFGDAPERTYPTVLASNGAYHTLTASLLMGRQVDAEPDGQPSPNADGDDLNGPGPNDEDGVLAWRGVWPGNPAAEVDVVVVGKGLLQVWLDLDGDGFGPEDQIIADWPVATGAHTISFAVPAGARMPPITLAMSRFRLSPVAGLGPAGFGGTGEVEDHVVEVSPPPPSSLQGMKWHDLDGDCALNGNELPLQGWTIYLLDADGNVVVTAQTGEDGRYAFTVPAGSYTVQEENRPFWGQTCPHNGGTWHVTVRPGEAVAGLIFGNRELLDFGDAPDTAAAPKYPTLLAHDGARHHIDAAVYLGTRIDGETDAYVSAAADGDDTYGTAGDDEDGVYFVSPLFFGADAKVSVRASAAGKLDAWLDFTADGDWDDAGEQIFATQALVAGNNILTFTVPLAAAGTHAITLARFRFSSAGGLGCDGEAADGEVEDYLVTIFEKPQGHFKWQQPPVGDPDSLHPDDFWGWDETSVYGVQAIVADDWQCNTAQPVTDIHWWGSYLGYTDDVPPADGPELFHLAIWTDAPIDLGADPPVAFSRPAKLVWETWAPRAALNERFVRYDFHPDHPDRRDACFQYDFDIPWNDWFIQSDGENVYWLSIAAIYPAGHCVEEGGGAGVPTPCHPWGWLTRPHKYGDDAVRILAPLKPEPGSLFESGEPVTDLAGASWDMAFMLTTRPVGVIEGAKWRDDDGDGLWKVGEPAIPGAKVYVDLDNDSVCDEDEPAVWTDGSGAYRLENIPAGTWPVREEVSDCWRQTYPAGGAAHVITLEPGGTAIEIHFGNQPLCDWGDAPERPYQTTAAAKGARHRATPNLCLGAASDIEPDGQPTTAADGDDNNGADDEDGVTNWQGLWAGNPAATVDVTVTGTGLLSAWIDFAGDGFDTGGDQIAADLAVTSGTHSLSFAVPSGLAAGNLLVARFRLSATAYLPWCGPAPDGEVEDYVIATTETPGSEVRGRKWNDLDGDGVQGNGEAGLPGWPVYLAQLGGLTVAKTTEMDGTFAFAGVAPGEYRLYEGQQESWRQTCPASPDGYTFTIVGGQTVEGKDFGNLHLLDWGDAPDGVAAPGYPTLATHEGASHVIAGPRLGEAVDADFDGQPTAGADGDDTDADGNDEDGVTFDGPLQAGSWAQADVVLSNATDALLAAWIDFNRDGDWGDAGEQVADDFALAVGTTELPFLVPADALPGQTYARFRLSSQSVSVGGQAPDGEVEDYLVLIRPAALEADADLGDAPDSTNTAGAVMSAYGSSATPASFPTVYRAGSPPYGPIHLHPGALAWLGSEVSLEGEADTGPDADALNNLDPAADAANQDGDDDALDDAPYLPHCEPTRFAFSLSTLAAQSATLYVNVWLDFNRDGDWNDTLACDGVSAVPEWAVQNLAVGVTGTGTLLLVTPPFLSWTPADVADHPLWLRITLAEQPWNPQGGIAPDGGSGPASGYQYGETEDYLITPSVVPLAIDFGDAPEVSGAAFHYPTLLGSNGAAHLIVEGAPYFGKDGDQPDADADGQPTPLADGDDYDTDGDDENGVYVPTLIPGQTGRFSVSIGGAAGHVTGWVDLDGNGVWEDDERLLDAFHPTGTSDWGIPIPADAKVGQTYARFRISTTRQGLPTGLAPDGEVEDHLVFIREAPEQLDWGDAPQNYDFRYPTKAGANGARHCIAGPWLGSDNDAPDAETDGQPDANARGDNANGADDENGVFIPPLPKGGTATLTFQVSGMKATVRGWIDFNADLDWDDPGEQVVFGPYDVGLHTVTVDVPADAVIGQTFARFRISTHRDMGPAGLAPNGEVEDYAVRVVEPPVTLDFGDAPELTDTQGLFLGYPTTLAHDGARHFIAGPWLGSDSDAPDPEADGKPEPLALGDDTDAAGDDENGVLIPPMIPGETVTIAFQVNGGGGWVSGWIDFNADRIWANPGERVVHAYYADGAHTETVAVPAKAVVGPSFARFRITTQAYAPALTAVLELGPTGLARDGEVEDHIVHIKEPPVALDFGDAPEIPGALSYPTTLAHDGARHYIAGPYFGTDGTDLPDGESDGQPTAAAFGDDSDSGGDDEDGILLSTLVRGQNGTATFHVMGGGHVRAWIDFNGDGDWDDGDEMVVDSFYTEGEYGLIFHVPSDAALGRTYARFRITTSQAAFGATGLLPDGEVEDHATRIAEAPVTYDFGDAPTAAAVPGYPTLLAQDGARHAIGGPWFGEDETDAPDAETDGQPEATALGDDNDAAGDDENDILFRPLVIGLPNAVTLNLSGGGGVVKIWIDFNGNKAWEAGELVHVGEHGSGGHTFNIAVPANAQPGITFARCRVSSNGGFGIVGEAPDGEVEDHAVLLVREMPGLDFGDAPDAANAAGYPTLLAHDGARHYALGAWLGDDGDAPDTEDDGTPQPDALGDDTTSSDDENGVAFLDPLVPGANARLTFQVSGMGAYLNGWVDYDRNGAWESGEQVVSGYWPVGTHTITLRVPTEAQSGETYARFRLSPLRPALDPVDLAFYGEVEDLLAVITPESGTLDFGDAPAADAVPGYPTRLADDGARHTIGGPWLGDANDRPDNEADGQPDGSALGDDHHGSDDEDGVVIPPLERGSGVGITLQVSGMGGYVRGWIDFNGNRAWDDPAERVVDGYFGVGFHTVNVSVPPGAEIGQTFARFRIATRRGLSPAGYAADGEVEDLVVAVTEPLPPMDYGDAPETAAAAGYPTLYASNGARHVLGVPATPYLGEAADIAPDADPDGLPTPTASGDDSDGGDDENGVAFTTLLAPGRTATVKITAPAGGFLDAWIDFNADGDWQDDGEQVFTSTDLNALPGGEGLLDFAAPTTAKAGANTHARFRVSSRGGLSYDGQAADGEVEDHPVRIGFVLTLVYGWNLFSVPLEPDRGDPGIHALFTDPQFKGPVTTLGPDGYEEVTEADGLHPLIGYWVLCGPDGGMEDTVEIPLSGSLPPTSTTAELPAGWSLVGPVADIEPPDETDDPAIADYFWKLDHLSPDQPFYNIVLPTEKLERGHGYWIYLKTPTSLPLGSTTAP